MKRSALLAVLLVFASSIFVQPVTAGLDESRCNEGETKTIVEKDPDFETYIEYTFQFSSRMNTLCLEVENKGGTRTHSGFRAIVDGAAIGPKMPSLEPGESTYVTKNITGYLDARRDNHTVLFGAYQKEVTYNFTQRSSSDNSTIPSPVISDVEVIRYENNDSTGLRVSTFNPSKRGYAFYIQVESFATDGEYTVAAPQENETTTATLPLSESTDEVVAGKVRIFDEPSQPETKFDQKEFMAKPETDTRFWDVEFKQVPASADTYSYQNDTAQDEYRGYDDDLLSPVQKQAGAIAIVL